MLRSKLFYPVAFCAIIVTTVLFLRLLTATPDSRNAEAAPSVSNTHIKLPVPPPFPRAQTTVISGKATTGQPYVMKRVVNPDGSGTVTITNRPPGEVFSVSPPSDFRPSAAKSSVQPVAPVQLTLPPSEIHISRPTNEWLRPTYSISERDVSGSGTGQIARIVIVRSACKLLAMNRAGAIQFVRTVALGKLDGINNTPLGRFEVSELYLDPIYSPSDRVRAVNGLPAGTIQPWRAYPVQTRSEGNPNGLGAGWIGLTGNGTSGLGIHGTNDPSSIGTFASDSCVRMPNADIVQLVGLCRPGTIVDIVDQFGVAGSDVRD